MKTATSKALPIIFDDDAKDNVSEQFANQKCDIVEKQKKENVEIIFGEQEDVVGFRIGVQIITFCLFLRYVCCPIIIHTYLQKISCKIEDSKERQPRRVYFGEEGQMMYSYTRRAETT